ncbi:MAG: RNA-metabolising metallo-beta-lactamase [Clostridia bacterium]|jgi:metallo-beta-lactamase family protein|uniref:MBL fold metallo-hydrolase RNA specificity domain-containing protein n=1 Tax=Petroclostridium xylanilyticum TaxID=1792311 RepID=UPI000B991E4A|nr:MBL fold metallo-hydrolase [Petroclostridium xylanilyticum]MBZ4645766.1 RNA-metabolising metallo-beta-lactamase [Clostridia bacterium]
MNVTFLGAAKTVTGSCYYLEVNNKKILVDCGLFQGHEGDRELNYEPFPFRMDELDYVLLTHAHIDHSGRIPKLYKDGYRGEVIATKATVELCEIMLPDSGHIQEMEIEWTNRKRLRAGKAPVEPLYTYQDAIDCISVFRKVSYDEFIKLQGNITIRFRDAGHILGSSILEMWVNENGHETKIVFSGDLGNKDMPILRDPTIIDSADYLFIESTYGDRLHHQNENKVEKFVDIIIETIEKGGNVVIPSFAVGRTQEIIYDLHKQLSKYDEKIKKLFNIPVYVDSPLAISATEVFRNNLDCYDEEAREYVKNGDNPLDFPTLKFTTTAEESKELNEKDEKMIIISASGMCEAGRIKHHLKHNLWRPESTILFVGYQAEGTLGRKILDGAKKVRIFGEEISVNARIESIDSFSGHADQKGLLDWIDAFKDKPKKIFIIHGEANSQKIFAEKIQQQFNIECIIPDKGETFSITPNRVITAATANEQDRKYRYSRLQLLEYTRLIEEEVLELSDFIKNTITKETDDIMVESLLYKLKDLEKNLRTLVK